MDRIQRKKELSSSQIILLGFLAVILAGTLLLMLPVSAAAKQSTPFLDALFTATSAVCVTGLVVHDTATYWSAFGQAVILAMIQIGGMGVVTISVSIARYAGRRIGLMQRSTMQEAISAPQVGGIVRLTGFILKGVVIFELAGTAALFPVFAREFGWGKGLWYALFHSISAFCNAGFDLMGVKAPFSSLTSYSGHPVVNIVIMLLIIIGGLGFLTWEDIATKGFRFKRYRMQSKAILTVTAVFILLPAVYFYVCEFSRAAWSGLSIPEKLWDSLFQAVTPRTAGFNSVDLSAFSEAGQLVILILMLIGGSPGSTAGGMKTTTVVVLFASAAAVFKRRQSTQLFGRRIGDETVRSAAAILLMYLVLFLAGGMFISRVEELPLMVSLFETASAVGTVGLSMGITGSLCAASRLVLIVLMYFGRVGGLTLIFAAFSEKRPNVSKLPQEKITVG